MNRNTDAMQHMLEAGRPRSLTQWVEIRFPSRRNKTRSVGRREGEIRVRDGGQLAGRERRGEDFVG